VEVFKIIIIGIISVLFCCAFRKDNPQFAVFVSITAGIIIMMFVINMISEIAQELNAFISESGIKGEYVSLIFKIVGISYICQMASQICKDAGESAVGTRIEIAGKIVIAYICMPLITALYRTVMDLL